MREVGRYDYDVESKYRLNVDASEGTAKVGSYLPNAWGLYDIHGNVWEWCLDWGGTYPGMVSDPMGVSSGSRRVVRGGSWYGFAYDCRVAIRGGGDPGAAPGTLGFRVALPLGQ